MDLATMVIRLEAQSAVLQTNLDQAETRLKRYESNTNSSLKRIDDSFKDLGSGVKEVITALLGFEAVKSVIEATNESAKASAQLSAAVAATGASAGFTAPQLQKMAESLSETSTYSHDAVEGMQALLLSFTRIRGPVLQDAQKAILDLATRLGVDLKSATETVGKALDNPIEGLTALQKAGIRLSETQKQNIKDMVDFGDVAGAQEVVIKAIEDRFRGAADAAANTFSGAMQQAGNALHDLMEQGELPEATAALKELTTVLKDPGVKQGVDSIFTTIITLASKAVALLSKTAAGLKILATGRGGNDSVDIDNQITALQKQRADIADNAINEGMQPEQQATLLKQLDDQIATLMKRLQMAQDGIVDFNGDLKEVTITATKLAEPVHDLGEVTSKAFAQFGSNAQDAATALAKLVSRMDDLGDVRFDQFGTSLGKEIDAAGENALKEAHKALDNYQSTYEEFLSKAARGTQDVIADTLSDGFKDGFSGILTSFSQMLQKIIAQLVAADLTKRLFGAAGGGDTGTSGWVGAGIKAVGAFFGGTRDSGGRGAPGMSYAIGTGAQPEIFTPDVAGTFTPANKMGGGTVVNNHFYMQSPTSRQTQAQVALRAGQGIAAAQRLNG